MPKITNKVTGQTINLTPKAVQSFLKKKMGNGRYVEPKPVYTPKNFRNLV